ncbi:MAG: EamA family transporter RarD [Pseudomonadota bacterium]|nr:EamA family transporter RarD [Pseudomonadota bacterium]
MPQPASIDRRGLAAAIGAYAMWGVFPLFWHLLREVPSLQIIAHRVIWCGVFVVGYLLISDGMGWWRKAFAVPRIGLMLLASSILISVNWGLFIWSVTHGHVVESSLGYFINPLVSILIGVVVLRERLNRVQSVAVVIAAIGVLWLTVMHGSPPWIALSLALSFAFYGLIRKLAAVDAMAGLAIESLILLLPAMAWLLWSEWHGGGAFMHSGGRTDVLLMIGGVLTALPLVWFAYGARRIPFSLIGILQYLSPSLQLLCGVLLLGESFSAIQAIGFSCIWLALALYAIDGIWRARSAQKR